MHEGLQMQHLGEGQHWSGQGILEGLCVDTPRFGGSGESKPAEDAFTKLLANFEAQELPSTLHQSVTLTPFRRQRKNCRPLRIPPTLEAALPSRDGNRTHLEEGDSPINQHSPPPHKPHHNKTFLEIKDTRQPKPLSPRLTDSHHMDKPLQNGVKHDCFNSEAIITHQENGWDLRNLISSATRYDLSNDKLSKPTHGRSLPNLQWDDINLDSLCSTVCRNSACRAKISSEASFCRRCSCCICKLFDNKRDASLWIICDPKMGGGCGLSCHIECALKQQVAGVVVNSDGSIPSLDGSYYCLSCRAIMPLIGCWREQLLVAIHAPTLDVLHYRLLLSYRLLRRSKTYKDVCCPIEEAIERLDAEVALGSVKPPQGSVDMLSCKKDVQRLINLALEKADIWSLGSVEARKQAGHNMPSFMVSFEDVSASSVAVAVNASGTLAEPNWVGYKLWHRRTGEPAYACTPTSILYNMDDKCVVSNLQPLTDYTFKIVPFSMEGDIVVCEADCSTKSAVHVESPMDVYASLGVLLINTESAGGGTSRCINESFNLDYHLDDGKNGLKIQDLEEVQVDQSEQGQLVSSKSPSTLKEKKEKCEGLISVYRKRSATMRDERRGLLAQRDKAGVQEERNLHSLNASGTATGTELHTGIRNSSMKMSAPVSFDCWDDKLSRKCLKTTIQQDLPADSEKRCHAISSNPLCSSNGSLPSQSWVRQGHDDRQNATVTINMQANKDLAHRSNDCMQGVFTCNTEAEFNSYEFSVKVIRWLECKGHLKEEFRMKFLTWFTLRASEQEKRVISVFIDTFQDDPASLAGQLVDAFEEMVGIDRHSSTLDGFCKKLW